MKCTPLFKTHQKYGAKFTEFNGWNMPLWFSSLENEHLQVRADSGVFDVSHMGEIIIEGMMPYLFSILLLQIRYPH